ncbi:MAG: ankyrin repeat domain-containing protein [Cyanobacteriota bacterium]|nr:ankyrin repeat domain-containing protein [Cyanobacteriota bacterium]
MKYYLFLYYTFFIVRGLLYIPLFPFYFLWILPKVIIALRPQKEIHKFVDERNLPEIKKYILAGKNLDIRNTEGETALHRSLRNGYLNCASLLVNSGATINIQNRNGLTPLNLAALFNRKEIYDLLIKKGAKVDFLTSVLVNDVSLVREMLEGGADPNIKYQTLSPLLHLASHNGYYAIAKLLIKKGAKVNIERLGNTALTLAIEGGHLDVIELLIASGADVNQKTKPDRSSPLHKAVSSGRLEIVSFLIDRGAQVNVRDGFPTGNTPLHLAVLNGDSELSLLLLENGADPYMKNWLGGVTSIDLARQNYDLANVLLQHIMNRDSA